jgi:hypothetical protein
VQYRYRKQLAPPMHLNVSIFSSRVDFSWWMSVYSFVKLFVSSTTKPSSVVPRAVFCVSRGHRFGSVRNASTSRSGLIVPAKKPPPRGVMVHESEYWCPSGICGSTIEPVFAKNWVTTQYRSSLNVVTSFTGREIVFAIPSFRESVHKHEHSSSLTNTKNKPVMASESY